MTDEINENELPAIRTAFRRVNGRWPKRKIELAEWKKAVEDHASKNPSRLFYANHACGSVLDYLGDKDEHWDYTGEVLWTILGMAYNDR